MNNSLVFFRFAISLHVETCINNIQKKNEEYLLLLSCSGGDVL